MKESDRIIGECEKFSHYVVTLARIIMQVIQHCCSLLMAGLVVFFKLRGDTKVKWCHEIVSRGSTW